MPKTMSDLERENEILSQELLDSRYMFAENLKSGLGEQIKATLAEQKETEKRKKKNKPSKFKLFLKRLADICQ